MIGGPETRQPVGWPYPYIYVISIYKSDVTGFEKSHLPHTITNI